MPNQTHRALPAVALTIAGSDNSAGAGIQADLKTFSAYGVYGLTAVTCIVAEIPGRVSAIQSVEAAVIRQQIELSLGAYPVSAIKTGMLRSRETIELVAEIYPALAAQLYESPGGMGNPVRKRPPLVVDPVMVATSGDRLLDLDAVRAYEEKLFPLATLVTPNLDEASVLLGGRRLADVESMRAAGVELCATYKTAFLMKGGHLGGAMAIDILCAPGKEPVEFSAPFTHDIKTHGTGCTYSAAITAGLALGLTLEASAARAKSYLTRAVHGFFRWECCGQYLDALNHWAN